MGWQAHCLEVEERTNRRTHDRDFKCWEPDRDWLRVAYYGYLSGSITLELKLQDLGWTVQPSPYGRQPDPAGFYHVTFVNGEQLVSASAKRFEEALARAAVKATAQAA